MYELNNGSKRLATALKQIQGDTGTLQRLADLLQYRPKQLSEDIDAIYDKVYAEAKEAAQPHNTTGTLLQRLRGDRNPADVARECGITESCLLQYEAGGRVPHDEVKIALSKYYGIPVAAFF